MFKRNIIISALMIVALMLYGSTLPASAAERNDFIEGYNSISERAEAYSIPFSMTYEEYVCAFEESGFETTEEYADAYLGIMIPNKSMFGTSSDRSSGSDAWYYNTGTSLPSNASPDYSQYNLYATVKKGDVIFEAKGFFGITGHIAIVEGKYYNAALGVNYIRIIEAIEDGVVRSCLDDTRVNDKDVTLLRVSGATSSIVDAAVEFCIGELGSSYSLDFQKDTSSSETDWYCSELVWAAYYNQGIDIEVAGNGEPGITPRDIKNCELTYTVNFK